MKFTGNAARIQFFFRQNKIRMTKVEQYGKGCLFFRMSDLFRVVKIDKKGLGCVASKNIKRWLNDARQSDFIT